MAPRDGSLDPNLKILEAYSKNKERTLLKQPVPFDNGMHFCVIKTLKHTWPWLLAVFVAAFLYRSLYFMEVWRHPLFLNPVIDAEQHHAWAQRISAGCVLGRGPDDVFKPLVYSLFLGGIYCLFGPNMNLIQWLQFALGAISAALTALLGVMLIGKKGGVTAGFIFALYAPFLFFEGQLLTPTLSILLNLLMTLMLISSSPSWGKIGLLGGVAAGIRPDVLAPLALVCLYRLRGVLKAYGGKEALRGTVFLLSGILAVAIPVAVRNYSLTGQMIFFSSNAGINFYTGNSSGADGVSAIPTGLSWERAISTVPTGMMKRPKDVSRLWFSRGFREIAQDPFSWLGLLGKKAFAFFNGWEFRNNIGYDWFRKDVTCLRFPMVQYWPISALALLGIFLCIINRNENSRNFVLLLWIAGYFVVSMAFFVTARFRLPAVPFMIMLAAWSCFWIYNRCTGGLKWIARSALLLILVFAFTWPGWFDSAREASSRDYINLGNVFRKNMASQKAISAYEKAHKMDPSDPEGLFLAGTTYLNSGRPEKAIEYLERAASLCPEGADILLNLGNAHFQMGNIAKAEGYYRDLIELESRVNLYHKRSSVAKAHIGLWRVFLVKGENSKAQSEMELAWKKDEQVASEYNIMNELDLVRASKALERLTGKEPWNWYPKANLGIAYLKMGQFDRAVSELRNAADMRGALPGVRFYLAVALIKSGKVVEGKKILEDLLETLPESAMRKRIRNTLDSL